jgi:hypothetical protein
MLKLIKRILIVATVVVAASAPAAASAKYIVEPSGSSATSGPAQHAIVASVRPTAASDGQSFEWGDAGIGAAGVLVLIGVGSGALGVRRRRAHQPLMS